MPPRSRCCARGPEAVVSHTWPGHSTGQPQLFSIDSCCLEQLAGTSWPLCNLSVAETQQEASGGGVEGKSGGEISSTKHESLSPRGRAWKQQGDWPLADSISHGVSETVVIEGPYFSPAK